MKLQVFKRETLKKSETKRIRREGDIPCVLYVRGKPTHTLTAKGAEFSSLMRTVLPGRLSTTIFKLIDEEGNERKALVKEIQYEPTTYNIQHMDFEQLFEDVKVRLKVPVECIGAVDCVGIKLGGVLRQVIRHVRVDCLPKDIPSAFQLDVKSLALFETKRLSEINIPETIRPLTDLKEVAVVIAKR